MDSVYDNFIKRFGDFTKDQVQSPKLDNKLKMGANGVGQASSLPFAMGHSGVDQVSNETPQYQIGANSTKVNGVEKPAESGVSKFADGVDLTGAISGGLGLVDSFTGSGMNTDALSGGPGKARGHILKGASSGAQLGSAIMPGIGTAVGAAVGGIGSALAHGSANKEYFDNKSKQNMKDIALEEKENRDDYRMSKGLASIADSKELLKRQLNIIS